MKIIPMVMNTQAHVASEKLEKALIKEFKSPVPIKVHLGL